jgi:hypothetical protein
MEKKEERKKTEKLKRCGTERRKDMERRFLE